ncbi:MAG: DUF4389 domain-containing protein [Gammaproteobacteria bacterium]|nr:DUF4389 domain-containing protein [Gammaproteobacteria bacterium]
MADEQKPGPDEPSTAKPVREQSDLERNVKSQSTWLRLLFMIIIVLLLGLARVVTAAVVILQFFWVLFTGAPNPQLAALGQSLATYSYEAIQYLVFNSEQRPFPFDLAWPGGPPQS